MAADPSVSSAVDSLSKALAKAAPGDLPAVDMTAGAITLAYPTLALYEARTSADCEAVRKVVKVASAYVDHLPGGASVVTFQLSK